MAERSRHILLTLATVLVLTLFLHVAYGQCPMALVNAVVYEGAKNTTVSCGLAPSGERWTVRPTSKVATEFQITNFTNSVTPTLTGLFGYSQSGLLIRNATIDVNGSPLSTAGVYYVNFVDGTRAAVKLVVIRSGPTCSYVRSALSVVRITCTIIYADHPVAPMSATISCIDGGQTYSGSTTKTLITPYVYNSTAVITVTNTASSTFDCRAAFSPPAIGENYLAKNAPNFTANVTAIPGPTPSTPKPTTNTQTPTPAAEHSLTKKPTNTADVAGSINITLECASTYGTDVIPWYFTPLRPPTNETIYLSSGYQLFETYQQKYALNATVSSSILIVRQLSSSTEGTYSCTDSVESASALLLVIPFPISMEPLFGPVSGGTSITITGSSPSDYPPSDSRSYIPDLGNAINVYIGRDLSATPVPALSDVSSAPELEAITPNTTEISMGQPMPVIVEFSSTLFNMAPFNMTFNKAFTYLPNPEITGISPSSFIVDGGELMNVTGRSLSSVANPIIQLTVFIYRGADGSSTSNPSSTVTSELCTVPPGQSTSMQCPMPSLNLPDDFLAILNSLYNDRRKRSIDPNDPSRALTVTGSNGVDRADIYLGFSLDGIKEYENINDALPVIKLIFYSAPELASSDELIQFDPSEDELIYVKGRYMMRGSRLVDYVVHIGNQICTNSDLQDNQLSCRPPKVKPSSTMNDTIYCGQYLSVTVTIGNKQYQYACLNYTTRSITVPIGANTGQSGTNNVPLIVGLTVGLFCFAILLILLIIFIVSYLKQKKINRETYGLQNTGEQDPGQLNYNFHSLYRPNVLFWRNKGAENEDDTNSQSRDEYYSRRRPEENDDNVSVTGEENPRWRQERFRNVSGNEESGNRNDGVYSLYRPRSLFWRRKGVNSERPNDAYQQSHEDYYPRRRPELDGDMIANEGFVDDFDSSSRNS